MLRAFSLAPGVLPLGLLFGAAAGLQGFTVASAVGFSAAVFAGATQFAVLALLQTGASLWAAIGLVAILNMRYLLLSVATLDMGRRAGLGTVGRVLLGLGVVEEAFALQAAWAKRNGGTAPRIGLLVIPATLATMWLASTAVGLVVGARLPPLGPWGLDYALPGIFVGLFGVFAEDRGRLRAGVVAVVLGGVLGLFGLTLVAALVVPPFVAAGAAWWVRRRALRRAGVVP